MRERADPLFPILATAVSIVVLGSVVLVFYPKLSGVLGGRGEAVERPPEPTANVHVWACRSVEGAALLLKPYALDREGLEPALDTEGVTLHYLLLSVFNFSAPNPVLIDLGQAAILSPEGGAALVPVAGFVRADAPASLRPVLRALGALATRIEVAPGRSGQLLLAVTADPSERTAFVTGEYSFERVEISRQKLAAWLNRPDWKGFEDF
jgi:hypothetical protein